MAIFRFFETLESTIDEAHACVQQGAKEGLVIVAFEQVKGRARRGRSWENLPGNLYMTFITYLNYPLSEALQLSFVTCVAVGEYLRSLLPPGHGITYKWPNDLLLNGKKVGGLLLEAIPLADRQETAYLISCGLNLVSQPLHVRYPTTSFQNEGIFISLKEALYGITTSLEHYISLWKKEGFSPIHSLWMDYAAGLEQKISFDLQGKLRIGIFKGINEEGALLLRTSAGLKKFTAGEILAGEQHASSH
ncbi:MAG: biotin--[acetyl-CoA-carboxylase] ligase [Alphaproteobacteria bacterium]|nr:biotin--[acetyl-CoA-carboxylase] ligase [Alphaproteobacteria bacterium]